jgi:hypothetical protein
LQNFSILRGMRMVTPARISRVTMRELQRVVMHREAERREKAMEESSLETRAIIAELKEHRDERRALIEAIFRVIDRLDRQQPPPPPDLRSV